MKIRHALFAAATSAVLVLAAGAPAQAAEANPFEQQKLTLASTSVKTTTSPECAEAVNAAIAAGATDVSLDACTRTIKLTVSPARRVTQADLANANLSPAEVSELSAAVNAGTLRTKEFRQEQINVTDMETQYGLFYYDGERAWIKTTYRGVKGQHKCVVNYQVGLAVTLEECSDSGSNYQRRIYAKWKFSALFNGFPASWTETYALNATAQGSLWQ